MCISFSFLSTLYVVVASLALNFEHKFFFLEVRLMPLQVICEKCGFVLYEGEELKPPYEIIESHNGKCPGCSKRLSSVPKILEIRRLVE